CRSYSIAALESVEGRTMIAMAFFFSSRRRHTRSKRDWSSDVCSSDLRSRHWNVLKLYVSSGSGLMMYLSASTCSVKDWTYLKFHWLRFWMQIKKASSDRTVRSSRPSDGRPETVKAGSSCMQTKLQTRCSMHWTRRRDAGKSRLHSTRNTALRRRRSKKRSEIQSVQKWKL